jgi:hypothetical protein
MKSLVLLGVMALGLAATMTGCAESPCEVLEERCDSCADGGSALGCSLTAGLGDDDACQQALDDPDLDASCPGE